MFDIGFWEFALIAIVALMVVGPDRLPSMVRTAGQLMGRAKRTLRELKYDLERQVELEEIDRLKNDFSKKRFLQNQCFTKGKHRFLRFGRSKIAPQNSTNHQNSASERRG